MIAVLDYGIGNLRSAAKALEAAGADARLVTTAAEADAASGVVLPGVGAFGSCMSALRRSGLDEVVHRVVAQDKPFLGVCVGMQMLFDSSEESPGVAGLGVVPGTVKRLPPGMKHPQMQWNFVNPVRSSLLLEPGEEATWGYFVHSYFVAPEDSRVVAATCSYGVEIPAIIERDNVTATQFHPEKSSTSGLEMLARFVKAAA